jgi:hypothetical protein
MENRPTSLRTKRRIREEDGGAGEFGDMTGDRCRNVVKATRCPMGYKFW